jgi:hypothetical protein
MDEVFMDLGGDNDEGLLQEAREDKTGPIRTISLALKRADGSERRVHTYEEYGDAFHQHMLSEMVVGYGDTLHENESLRMVTHQVDITLATPFKFPNKDKFEDQESRIRYAAMHGAREFLTILVTWLVTKSVKKILTWDVEQGDGEAMYEHAIETVKSVKWNKLLSREEKLEIIAYDVPPEAMCEVPNIS